MLAAQWKLQSMSVYGKAAVTDCLHVFTHVIIPVILKGVYSSSVNAVITLWTAIVCLIFWNVMTFD